MIKKHHNQVSKKNYKFINHFKNYFNFFIDLILLVSNYFKNYTLKYKIENQILTVKI